MNWQPPPPPPRPGGPGPGGPGGPGGQRPGGPGPGGFNGQQPQQQQPQPQQPGQKDWKELNYYQLLQVNREAHSTIIRYAYRFLAAMYHPDNSETGDAEKFRVITEAWRTLSDEGKRAAYDMSLGAEEAQPGHPRPGGGPGGAPQPGQQRAPGYGLPKNLKTGISWQEIELRLAILQILLDARKKKPKSGGASAKLIMDVLSIDNVEEVEYALWYLREKGLIEPGERLFMITAIGVDYIVDQLNKNNSITESETEKKVKKVVEGGVPAVIPR